MTIQILQWLMAVIAVEAVVEIVVDSELFLFWRVYLSKKESLLGRYSAKLFTCGYCFSVWVAATVAWSLPGYVFNVLVADIILKVFILHRMSNMIHELFNRWLNRYPISFMLNHMTGKVEEEKNIIDIIEEEPEEPEEPEEITD